MEYATMGRVLVPLKVENLGDLYEVDKGERSPELVRQIEIAEALVDTGATLLALPRTLIDRLGLKPFRQHRARTTAGPRAFQTFGTVQLTIQGRQCRCDVSELSEDCPVLVGQIPLELMDFVVDPKGQRLIGNPEHGGEWMLDMF